MRKLGYEVTALATLLVTLVACEDKTEPNQAAAAASASAAAAKLARARDQQEPPPGPCKAAGDRPTELGSTQGTLHGLVSDDAHLFYTTWQLYGGRGDVAMVRKDGGGIRNLISVKLEPRDIAVDDGSVFYTEGIRLKKVTKSGEKPETLDDNFSSQSIALHGGFIFGVPGDYGPYDRLVRQATQGGPSKELDTTTRPELKDGPVGFSDIAVDESGAYVADSGNGQILRFELDRAKPKILSRGQARAYSLALAGDDLYFTLALKRDLLVMPKSGGKPKKLASGLVKEARIAADATGALVPISGDTEDAPVTIFRVPKDESDVVAVAVLPPANTVEAIAVDDRCVYWAQRETGSAKLSLMAKAK